MHDIAILTFIKASFINYFIPLIMQLLTLRYYQLKRDLGYWVPVFAALAFYVALQVDGLQTPYQILVPAAVLMFLLSYHLNRPDKNFVLKQLDKPRQQMLVNYNLLVFPLSFGLLFSLGWMYTLALHFLVSAVVFIEIKPGRLKLLFLAMHLPSSQFEWISGMRGNFFLVNLLLLIALVLSPVKLFGLVAIFLADTIFLSFYNPYEPVLMLNPKQLDADSFLNQKINFFIKVVLITNVPILAVNSVFNPDVLGFNFFFLIGLILLAGSTVYIKYASYKPNEQQGFNMDFLILFAALFLPYFLPLSLLIYYNNKRKAKNNLALYLDDKR